MYKISNKLNSYRYQNIHDLHKSVYSDLPQQKFIFDQYGQQLTQKVK